MIDAACHAILYQLKHMHTTRNVQFIEFQMAIYSKQHATYAFNNSLIVLSVRIHGFAFDRTALAQPPLLRVNSVIADIQC